jgi:hypothetical protein
VAAARELPRLYSLVVSWRGSLVVEHYQRGASDGAGQCDRSQRA